MYSLLIFLNLFVICFGQAFSNDFQLAEREDLLTWWHANGEWSGTLPTDINQVRRSSQYHVKVGLVDEPDQQFDSFTYASIPRNGMQVDPAKGPDGAEFALKAGLSMNWSSFVYKKDVYVYVHRFKQNNLRLEDIQILPSNLTLEKTIIDSSTVRIKVPYLENGLRFSVEFRDDLYTSYLQDDHVLSTKSGRSIHQEPQHALLIFANPPLSEAPNRLDSSVYFPQEGLIDLKKMEGKRIISFAPGTYYLPAHTHAYFPASVEWVYLAPGSYVKTAFEFQGEQKKFRVSGYGTLSGELYEYEPDKRNAYRRSKASDCHGDCIKLLQFFSTDMEQSLLLEGITLANPPYHSFVVYGNPATFSMNVNNFKQVGAWYWQTDGIEIYEGGQMTHSFLHSNDDVLKVYHSRVLIDDIIVWKGENGPVIQFGWIPRSFQDATVKNISVIHNRMFWPNITHNHCIINSAKDYRNPLSLNLGDERQIVKNILLENIHSEGQNLCAMRLYALSRWENIHIKNLKIDSWNELGQESQQSQLKVMYNPEGMKLSIGNETQLSKGLKIENYQVGKQKISKWNESWKSDKEGRLNFDAELWENWNAW